MITPRLSVAIPAGLAFALSFAACTSSDSETNPAAAGNAGTSAAAGESNAGAGESNASAGKSNASAGKSNASAGEAGAGEADAGETGAGGSNAGAGGSTLGSGGSTAGGPGSSGGSQGTTCENFVGSCALAASQCRDVGGTATTLLFLKDGCKAPSVFSTSPCPAAQKVGGCKSTGAGATFYYQQATCMINWFYPPNEAPISPILCPGGTVIPP